MKDLADLIHEAIRLAGGAPGYEDTTPRGHLGASIIGEQCWRAVYYQWRWGVPSSFDGRMLTLFETGFRYESRFIGYLKLIGIHVEEIDYANSHSLWYHDGSDSYVVMAPGEHPEDSGVLNMLDDVTHIQWHILRASLQGVKLPKLKQFGFKDETGHFAGSCDGMAIATGDEVRSQLRDMGIDPDSEFAVEFKSHNAKSYAKLLDEGIAKSKPKHWAQMHTYMKRMNFPVVLYCAVNKDTDEKKFIWVLRDDSVAEEIYGKAFNIIMAREIPARISNTPSWFGCKFCDYRMPCHYGKPLAMNCRTCRMSRPIAEGKWFCDKWNAAIPFDAQLQGCGAWQTITD